MPEKMEELVKIVQSELTVAFAFRVASTNRIAVWSVPVACPLQAVDHGKAETLLGSWRES